MSAAKTDAMPTSAAEWLERLKHPMDNATAAAMAEWVLAERGNAMELFALLLVLRETAVVNELIPVTHH